MKPEILFLGTSCMVPTKERNHVSFLLSYGTEGILFDCGEGTQRQLIIAGIKASKITKILISHWHGDHVLGIPGLMQTMGSQEYSGKLNIYGPVGTKRHFDAMFEAFVFDKRIDFEIHEIREGMFFESGAFTLEAYDVEHNTKTIGFIFHEKDKRKINVSAAKKLGIPEGHLLGRAQEGKSIVVKGKKISPDKISTVVPGKKISYIPDSVPCKNSLRLAKDADLLVIDATYATDLEEKAEEYKHMTAKQAALIANNSNVKKLALTHFSARYKTTHEIEEDAKQIFQNVVCAKDFMKIEL